MTPRLLSQRGRDPNGSGRSGPPHKSDIMLEKLDAKLNAWIQSTLSGTYHHFLCYFPRKSGMLAYMLRRLFYSGIQIGEQQLAVLKAIPENAIVVLVTKYKNYFDYLFYHTRYQQLRLPMPEIGLGYRVFLWQSVSRLVKIALAHFDHLFKTHRFQDPYESGYIEQELLRGRCGFLSLVEEKGFYRRFVKRETDPLRYLINVQRTTERPIYIVPHLMFYTRKPQRSFPTLIDVLFGSEGNPGRIRRLISLFKNPGNVFVEISEPLNLKSFMEANESPTRSIEYQALVLRRNLLVQINRHRQTITGPVLKSREELKENILTNDQLREFMANYAGKRETPLDEVYKQAESYLEEIAAKYSPALVKVYSAIVRWIIDHMFDGVTVNPDEINMVKKMYQKGPLIFVPCHKSHIDYIILNYILYCNNLPIPHVAAGKNLSFWPMGPLFRGGGAFFIRRSFRGAVLYSKVFTEYINKLLEDGFNIEFFIEGGRSRTGKLILPKLGLLSMLLGAYKKGVCNDLIFVPIYLGYDRIIEESSYMNEIEGGQKDPESILQVFKARKLLKRRYGRIYIKFHDPISLNDIFSARGLSPQSVAAKEINTLCRDLGFQIVDAINKVTVVTPHAVMASALLNCSRKHFSQSHAMAHVQTCMNYLNSQKPFLADTLVLSPDHAFAQTFDAYLQRGFIEQVSKEKDARASDATYTVQENRRPLMEYYKNNCIAFFIPAAFTALAILDRDAFQFSAVDLHDGYRFLKKLFINEFAYDVEKSSDFFVRKTVKAFIDDAILMPHPTLPDTYNITSAGYRKLKFFSRFLKSYLESYLIVISHFSQSPPDTDPKDRLKQIQALGKEMYKQGEIDLTEALSKVNYANAVYYFTTHDVKSARNRKKIKFYQETLRQYLNRLSS